MAKNLTAIPGIAEHTAALLTQHGFGSAWDIAAASVSSLCAVPGFGAVRAQRVIDGARQLLAESNARKKLIPPQESTDPEPEPEPEAKGHKKRKTGKGKTTPKQQHKKEKKKKKKGDGSKKEKKKKSRKEDNRKKKKNTKKK